MDAIVETSRSYKINEALIEKDYFVMLILSELNKAIPGLLFKGGTCCSHAYKAIDRFSEDIDLSLNNEHFGRSHNTKANKTVIEVCDRLGFKILNRDEVIKHSHGSFNRYYIEYPISFSSSSVKPFVQVEMAFYQKAYPEEVRPVNSIIGDWLIENGNEDAAKEFNLLPFSISVQKLERTFVDKVFAICDYFERKESERNSRHIYDLFKITSIIDLNDSNLKELIKSVRKDRTRNDRCISAKEGYDINETLKKIIESSYFKSDYENVTKLLLTKNVEYEDAINVLNRIIDSKLFLNTKLLDLYKGFEGEPGYFFAAEDNESNCYYYIRTCLCYVDDIIDKPHQVDNNLVGLTKLYCDIDFGSFSHGLDNFYKVEDKKEFLDDLLWYKNNRNLEGEASTLLNALIELSQYAIKNNLNILVAADED